MDGRYGALGHSRAAGHSAGETTATDHPPASDAAPLMTNRRAESLEIGCPVDEEVDEEGEAELEDGLVNDEVTHAPMDGQSSRIGAIANLMNSIIGTGIIGLPFALSQAGFVAGIVLILAVALLTDTTLRMLVDLGVGHSCYSYEELCEKAFGMVGFAVASLAKVLFAFGALVSYLIIVKDTVGSVLRSLTSLSGWYVDDHFLLTALATAVVLPVCFMRRFSSLERFSMVSLAAVLFMIFAVNYEHANLDPRTSQTKVHNYFQVHSKIAPAFGSIAFSFVCHHQTFLVYDSLKNPTRERYAQVAHASLGLSVVASLAMAIGGYTLFFENTEGDIFVNFDKLPGDPRLYVVYAARLFLCVNMFFTFPAELIVCRSALQLLLRRLRRWRLWREPGVPVFDEPEIQSMLQRHAAKEKERERALFDHVLFTVILWLLAVAIALAVNDLGTVLDVTGSFAAVFLAFILPAAVHIQIGWHPRDTSTVHDGSNWLSILLLLIGMVAFAFGTLQTIFSAAGMEWFK